MAPTQRPTKRQRTTEHHTKSIARVKPSQVSLKKPAPATTPSARKPTTVRTPASDKGKAKAERLQESLPSSFKVIAGSYEKLLYGLQGTVSRTEDGGYDWKLKPIFIFPAHVSCIKAVAASPNGGKWLATGSADEIIKVWDLRRRKEIGGLMHHEGSITHLSFPSRSHLLSASEDGSLCLFRARDWAVLRSMKGHKGRVNCVAVHPSGKVALSVGKDRTLRMWDLMRGKGSASTKLGKEGEVVRWSVSGALFVVQSQSTIDIYSTNMALLHTISHPSRIHDVCFVKRPSCSDSKTEIDVHELLLVGAEDKKLSVYDVPPTVDAAKDVVPTFVAELVGHSNRVKAVATLKIALPGPSTSSTTVVSTASSDGKILIYDLRSVPSSTTQIDVDGKDGVASIPPVAEYDSSGTRLTCLALADGDADTTGITSIEGGGKRKHEEADEEESDEDDDGWGSQEPEGEEGEEEEEEEAEEEEEEEGEED